MNPIELTAAITALANAIAPQLSDDEIGLMAAAFSQLGDTLATIAVLRAINQKKTEGLKEVSNQSKDSS